MTFLIDYISNAVLKFRIYLASLMRITIIPERFHVHIHVHTLDIPLVSIHISFYVWKIYLVTSGDVVSKRKEKMLV